MVAINMDAELAEQHRALLAAPVGIFQTDAAGSCRFVNDRWSELAGMPRLAALGAGWIEAIHPEDRERVSLEWTQSIEEQRDFALEYRFQRPDGHSVWLAGSATAFRDDSESGVAYVGTVTDISAAVATREALVEQGRFLDTILDIAGSLVCVIDPAGRFLRFNQACELASGYSLEEIRGRPFYEFLIPPEEIGDVRHALERLVAGDLPAPNVNHWVTRGGDVRLISWSNASFFDSSGSLTHIVSTGTDITEERAAQQAITERARLFTAMAIFAQAANSTLKADELVPTLLRAISATLEADMLGLVLLDHASGNFVVRGVHGSLDQLVVGTVIQVGQGVSGRAIASRSMIIDHVDRSQYATGLADLVDADSLYVAGVPLIHDGAILGAIVLGRLTGGDVAYSALEREALSIIAAQTALSLANARLVDEVSELAIRDGLTGLYNRRYFEASLEEMLRRRERLRWSRPPMAAIMFDLDHFGTFNKEQGHQAGDAVLRTFSGVLQKRFRASDLLARYGGEEFVAILEGTTIEEATRIADEVRRALEDTEILASDGSRLRATVSAGCAALDDTDMTREALLRAADVGLFMAKRAGRNSVVAV